MILSPQHHVRCREKCLQASAAKERGLKVTSHLYKNTPNREMVPAVTLAETYTA